MIDLHMHSIYSDDGEFTPTQLVQMCADKKINLMSLTDHNSVKGNHEASLAAQKLGVSYISGIEIDCTYQMMNLHVLGYGIDYHDFFFQEIEDNLDKQNFQVSLEQLAATQVLGFPITENEMWNLSKDKAKKDVWTGEMFAEVLLAKPELQNHPLLLPYRTGGSRSDNPYVNFYWDYYSQGKLCYVEVKFPSLQEVIDGIHQAGGLAVLAHPGINVKEKESLLNDILSLGIDGIEVFSSYHNLEQTTYYYQQATSHSLLYSCGSDFHGKTKPAISLGNYITTPSIHSASVSSVSSVLCHLE